MRLRSIWHFNRASFFVIDYILSYFAVICAFKLSPRYTNEILLSGWLNPDLRVVGYGMPLFMALGLQLAGLQKNQAGFRGSETLTRTIVGMIGGISVFLLVDGLIEYRLVGRFVIGFSFLYGGAFVLGSRVLLWNLANHDSRPILVYGGPSVRKLLQREIDKRRLPMRIAGQVTLAELMPLHDREFAETDRVALHSYAERLGVDEVVVDVSGALGPAERGALLSCTEMGIRVTELGCFFENEFEKVHVDSLHEAWFWGYDQAHSHPVFFAFKRALDITLSLAGMIMFAPVAPFLMLVIRLQDGGPAIYSQVRVGLNNKPFRIYKFRTMRLDAEKGGAQWARVKDNRVTRLGRFMRKTRIDELPQFWNILQGEMSFVGPRPERPELIEGIERQVPYYRYRHLVKPGLTGWAQINYPYGASIEDTRQKLAYDLYYLKYASITRELHIVLRTIVAAIQGAR